jgi:endonuclease V-like protein UPF0215 family
MKTEIRTIGFDDSPFTRADGRVPVVGIHMRGTGQIEGVLATDVQRDGGDATTRVARCVIESGLRGTKAILLDGASFAGFNVVDLEGLAEETRIPCIAFTKGVPDYGAIRSALRNVPDGEGKWRLIERRRTETLPTATSPITFSWAGDLDRVQAIEILALTTGRGLVPEPLRVAHLVASVLR